MASVDYYYKKNMAALDENMKKSIADSDTIYENQAKSTKDKYNAQIDLSNQEYDDSLRTNEVQKYINMREVAENNANLGLTDSGLNRTQSTAVQVSASNNAAKIERDRTNMVAALTGEMNRYLAEIENNRISSEASIRQGYESKAMEAAQSSYKADVDAAAKIEKEKIAAQEKYTTQKKTDYSNLYKHLSENKDDADYCAKLIDEYATLYNIDETGSEMAALLRTANLTLEDLTRQAVNNGSIYYTPNDYHNAVGEEKNKISSTGRIKWDYTTGEQPYKIVLKKATGNFLGWGVDNNDVVDICYPDGTPLLTDIRLDELPKSVGLKITKDFTAGKGKKDEGSETELRLDLSEMI